MASHIFSGGCTVASELALLNALQKYKIVFTSLQKITATPPHHRREEQYMSTSERGECVGALRSPTHFDVAAFVACADADDVVVVVVGIVAAAAVGGGGACDYADAVSDWSRSSHERYCTSTARRPFPSRQSSNIFSTKNTLTRGF